MVEFTEVGDRVWVARYPWFDANVTLVGGERGLVAVDTHGSAAAGRAVVDDVRRLGVGEVTAVVNTHWHFDHTFGNAAFREAYGDLPIHAHELAVAELESGAARVRERYAEDPADPHSADVLATEVVLPDHPFSGVDLLDLGDRAVELVHLGRGHTSGDLVVNVPDAGVLLAGDLVEESAPPSFGPDSWPLEWPATLDLMLGMVGERTLVVPGHGAPVDREYVDRQRHEVGVVAQTAVELAGRGVPADQALESAEWPWPRERIAEAVRLVYAHLPRDQKRLPMA